MNGRLLGLSRFLSILITPHSQVHLGVGYLELPQVEVSGCRPMVQGMLRSQRVYLLDAHTDLFVWVGAHSDRWV